MKRITQAKAWPFLYWLLPPVLLSLFTFFIYKPSLRYGFVFDDFPTIIEYIHARHLDVKGLFFGVSRWISRILNQYTFTHWGTDPYGYRIFDILLHIVIGIMVFALVATLFTHVKKNVFLKRYAYPLAILSSGLFLLHPVQTQTVSYITQMRLEGLVVFFVFAILLSFIYAARASSPFVKYGLYGLSFVLAAFSTGTKEIIVTLPFLTVLVDWFFIAEGDWSDFSSRLWVHGCLMAIVFWFLYRYGVAKPQNVAAAASAPVHNNRGNMITAQPGEFITTGRFFISQFKIIVHYLFVFFLPVGLSFDYGYKLSPGFFSWDVIFPLMILLTIAGSALYGFIKNRASIFTFCCAWFFVAILPRASIFPGTELACDYKTYVASFGLMMLLAFGLMHGVFYLASQVERLYKMRFGMGHYAGSMILFVAVLGGATSVRNVAWSSEETLWKDVLDKNPMIARAWNNYAVALNEKGDADGAMKMFERATVVDDFYAEPHINLATMLQTRGKRDQAYAHYMRALEIGEAHPELFNNLGMFHFEEKALPQAEACFKESIKIRPSFSRAWRNLGNLYFAQNKDALAEECYEHALHGDFIDDDLIYMHGFVCHKLGKYEKSIASFEKIVGKNYRDSAFYLGAAYFSTRQYAKARGYLQRMHQQDPNNSFFSYNFALVLLNIGELSEAEALFKQCMKFPKDHPYAALHHGRCLFELGKKQEAKKELKALLNANVDSFVKKDTLSYMKEVKLS